MPLDVDIVTRIPNVHWQDKEKIPGLVFFVYHDVEYSPTVTVTIFGTEISTGGDVPPSDTSRWLMARADQPRSDNPRFFNVATFIAINLINYTPGETKIKVSCPGEGPVGQTFASFASTFANYCYNFTQQDYMPLYTYPPGASIEEVTSYFTTSSGTGPRNIEPPTDDCQWWVLPGGPDVPGYWEPANWEAWGPPTAMGGQSLIDVTAYNKKETHIDPDWPTDASEIMDNDPASPSAPAEVFIISWDTFHNFHSKGKRDPHPPTNYPDSSNNGGDGSDLIYTLPVDWEDRPGAYTDDEGPPEPTA